MNKHTPGPWVVAYKDENGQSVVKGEHIEVATCWHHSVGEIEKEMRANARLIASAPEMLAALIAARDYLSCIPESAAGGDDDAVKLCLSVEYAIFKATGEKP